MKEQSDSLYDYYRQQYPKDLEIFKELCLTDKKYITPADKLFFVQDLETIKKNGHPLLQKKHFVYFMIINTAFLMEIHKHFKEKYEEFKHKNNGMVFEFGLTNTFIQPWEILERLNISFDKELFSDCIGWSISKLMTNDYFCGIIPIDFMDKFINDPDLNKDETSYGKEWKEICTEEWVAHTHPFKM